MENVKGTLISNPKGQCSKGSFDKGLTTKLIQFYQQYREQLSYGSEYLGKSQHNMGFRHLNHALTDINLLIGYQDAFFENYVGLFDRILETVITCAREITTGEVLDSYRENIVSNLINLPVFHSLYETFEGNEGEHRDLCNYTPDLLKRNLDHACLFTFVVFVDRFYNFSGGELVFPEIEREVKFVPGDFVVFNSALRHDIKHFTGERVSFVGQLILKDGLFYHYI